MIKIKNYSTDQYDYVTSTFFKRLLKLLILRSCLNASSKAFHIFGARYRQIRGSTVRWDLFIFRKLESLTIYRCHEGECLGYPGAFTVASQQLHRGKEGLRVGGSLSPEAPYTLHPTPYTLNNQDRRKKRKKYL